jgi:predicted permease
MRMPLAPSVGHPSLAHRVSAWLDAVRADAVFSARQLRKHRVTSAAAIVSLALAIGACTTAFRLVDAMLLRPLPVAHPEELYALERHQIDGHGNPGSYSSFEYPLFRRMRAAVADRAELLAIAPAAQIDLTFGADRDSERAFQQYVSGRMFASFGLRPAVGRLLTEADDRTPGAHPYAVLSYDFWTRRFGRDPRVVGRTLRIGATLYEIVGVANEGFTGTDTGTVTSIFLPAMMHPGVERDDWSWFRTWVRVRRGTAIEPLRAELQTLLVIFQTERAGRLIGLPAFQRERLINETLVMHGAGAGVSQLQRDHRASLTALAVLVALVLLIACANVANLMTAQTASRAREMALRVSIGAARRRLVQLVLTESAWLAILATALSTLFAWWATPFVVSMLNPPDNPVRLVLPADWRLLGFGLALAFGVTILFGLGPALRASAVSPAHALKGGADPHASRRVMHLLIGAQVAFCVLVTFVAGLFVATFDRLAHQPNGFSADRLLTIDVVARSGQSPAIWDQVAENLRVLPGVQKVALAGWPLLSGNGWNGFITVDGVRRSDRLTFFLRVSPGWMETMGIRRVAGRDFAMSDLMTGAGEEPGPAIVNETFVRTYFSGEPALGRVFEKPEFSGRGARYRIVAIVGDARYRSMRDPIPPVAYVPLAERAIDARAGAGATASPGAAVTRPIARATFFVRTTADDPLTLAPVVRREAPRVHPELRVSVIRTQQAINDLHTVRERLMATLALFIAVVALVLAGVGIYGVLDYSVLQRRRELGIRLALGAHAGDIARRVTLQAFTVMIVGSLVGLGLGLASVRSIETLFYGVRATDPLMLALPWLAILAIALLAALRPVVRAVRIDPVTMLRAE